ncbi:hypothetical protein [Leifsonia sp. Leaf264]|uniref:hypothetical protein n=1 Tax=Leifsonia sp. Leaf264 TaxID=1736314 RepID=UPI0006F775CE|nr:hypothetical protein [Leifsonia sp. Leaf264]KQO98516.1 hypothetical protein ASF30_10670 [Leifsonia sp. Leaf264]
MGARKSRGAVEWHVPGRKTPIAYSTTATSNLIGMLAADGLTFEQAHAAINYDDEAKAILTLYIERGHGETVMTEFGVRA